MAKRNNSASLGHTYFPRFSFDGVCQTPSKFLITSQTEYMVWHFNPFMVGVKTVLTPLAPVLARSKTEGGGRLGRKAGANFLS